MKSSSKGKSSGLHKSYFNGSAAQGKADHPIAKAPVAPTPQPKALKGY